MSPRANRQKISTTVAPETGAYLRSLVRRGKAANMAEAVDRVVAVARRTESRKTLASATAAYYSSLSGEALDDEKELELAVGRASSRVDFDAE
ncbi:MAG: hypothetical protein ACRD51_16220 [Candidatus Acidiferrum sp.]